MSELAEIKARASQRRSTPHRLGSDMCCCHDETEADLDRAIAIAEEAVWHTGLTRSIGMKEADKLERERDEARAEVERLEDAIKVRDKVILELEQNNRYNELKKARAAVLKLRDELRRAGDVLQTAYSAGNELGRCGVSLSVDWPKIQDQSYEEVGEFLYPDITQGGVEFYDRLAETEHYEAYR